MSWQIAAKPHAQRIICDFYRIAGRRRHFFLAELLFTDSAADDGARIGADADVGFAWSGGGDGAGAGRGRAATGSSATIAKFCSTDSGDFPRSPSLSPTRAREALMMAGAGGAMRATGWRATAIRFQQFGEGARCLRRALSPTFPAGVMVFFIPWRVVAEESCPAQFGFGGAMLLDLLGPMSRRRRRRFPL